MNIISKTINTLTRIVGATAAGFKVGFDISTKGRVRDMTFIKAFQIDDDYVEVWASDLVLQSRGADIDYPNAICRLPQAVKNGANHYFICVSRCALEDPVVCDALIAHECGHIIHKHLYNAAIANVKQGLVLEADYEIEADRFACELGFGDAMRKVISNAKETDSRCWTIRKGMEIFDARLAAIDNWTATSHK